ncbi:hypothetical protein STEG23_007521 [Scotinomys teguina]
MHISRALANGLADGLCPGNFLVGAACGKKEEVGEIRMYLICKVFVQKHEALGLISASNKHELWLSEATTELFGATKEQDGFQSFRPAMNPDCVLEAEKFKIKILPELLPGSKLAPTHDVFTR